MVHPRLRGELQGTKDASGMSWRFIPAYAGNSIVEETFFAPPSVHPRLRGELTVSFFVYQRRTGSSPLTRGTPPRLICILPAQRFIPAYAGNSNPANTPINSLPVHPRLRGELERLGIFVKRTPGSSPLTRGTHLKTV